MNSIMTTEQIDALHIMKDSNNNVVKAIHEKIEYGTILMYNIPLNLVECPPHLYVCVSKRTEDYMILKSIFDGLIKAKNELNGEWVITK